MKTIQKARERLKWHTRYHKPLPKSKLNAVLEYLYLEGEKPVGAGVDFHTWNLAFDLFLEVRRLKRELIRWRKS
jgi:hypothetical protein